MSQHTITHIHHGKTNMYALYKKLNECDQISQIYGNVYGKNVNIETYWDRVEEKALVCWCGSYFYVTNSNCSISTKEVLYVCGMGGHKVNVTMQCDKFGEVTPDNDILDMPISKTPLSHILIVHSDVY